MSEKLLVNMPKELKDYLKKKAKEEHTSMAHYIVTLISKDMERKK